MKNKKVNSFKFILSFLFVAIASVFFMQVSTNFSYALADSVYFETSQSLAMAAIDDLTIDYTETTTNTDLNSLDIFEEDYKGVDYELKITPSSATVTNFSYQWYYTADQNNSFTALVGQTNQTLKIKDCDQSGYYYCAVTNKDNAEQTSNSKTIQVVINKVALNLKWETLDNKSSYVYNGQDQIRNIAPYYQSPQNGKVYLGFSLIGSGHYYDELGVQKSFNYVNEFKNTGTYTATASLTLKEAKNYIIPEESALKKVFTITPAAGEATISKKDFVYNGQEQNVAKFISVNNTEQTLEFSGNYFTTVKEGNGKKVTAYAPASLNYSEINATFYITVDKATPIIDTTNVKTNFVYNGSKQFVNAGAVLKNENGEVITDSEQTLIYTNNYFTAVKDGNGQEVTIYVDATDNYNYVSTKVIFSVEKATINTSKWAWYYPVAFTYDGQIHDVYLTGVDAHIVEIEYWGNKNTNAGTYYARVKNIKLLDENYNEVTYNNILEWTINKALVEKPNCASRVSTYNAEEQTINFATTDKYTVSGNKQTKAGNYQIRISLNDNVNYKWHDGTSADLFVNWTINKAKVDLPVFESLHIYTGKKISVDIEENELWSVFYNPEKEVGKYSILLVLNDAENYEWENTTSAYTTLVWEIIPKNNSTTISVVAITLACLILVLLAFYLTLHSTVAIKRRRRRVQHKKPTQKPAEKPVEQPKEKTEKPVKKEEKLAENKKAELVTKTVATKTEKIEKAQPKVETKPVEKPKTEVKEVKTSVAKTEKTVVETKKEVKAEEPAKPKTRKKRLTSKTKASRKAVRAKATAKKAAEAKQAAQKASAKKKKAKQKAKEILVQKAVKAKAKETAKKAAAKQKAKEAAKKASAKKTVKKSTTKKTTTSKTAKKTTTKKAVESKE